MFDTTTPARPPVEPMKLMIILGSVRPKRRGLAVAVWAHEFVTEIPGVDIDFVDLAELDLPFMDEPDHPREQRYTKQHTKAWSARVQAADALLLVSPEYNSGYSPALKNALDFLHHEWAGMPVGCISYGACAEPGASALRPVLQSLGLAITQTNVAIPDAAGQMDDGWFVPSESQRSDLLRLVGELGWPRPTVPNDASALAHAVG